MIVRFMAAGLLTALSAWMADMPPTQASCPKEAATRTCIGTDCLSADIRPPETKDAIARGHLRLASFNIRIFSKGSRDKEELKKIVNVLKHYDIIAIQELRDTTIMNRAVERLNEETGAIWAFKASAPVGRKVKELYAFLYRQDRVQARDSGRLISNTWRKFKPTPIDTDAFRKVNEVEAELRRKKTPPFIREPFLASFRAGQFTFRLLTIHTLYDKKESPERGVELRQLAAIYREVLNDGDDRDLLLLGDFNDAPDHWRFDPIGKFRGMRCLTKDPQTTTIRDVSLYDTICFQKEDTDPNLVDPDALAEVQLFEEQKPFSEIAVPSGRYKQACLAVSDHRPIFTLFNITSPDID